MSFIKKPPSGKRGMVLRLALSISLTLQLVYRAQGDLSHIITQYHTTSQKYHTTEHTVLHTHLRHMNLYSLSLYGFVTKVQYTCQAIANHRIHTYITVYNHCQWLFSFKPRAQSISRKSRRKYLENM
jgi:hypothetical protein